jgi:hypothetical protein
MRGLSKGVGLGAVEDRRRVAGERVARPPQRVLRVAGSITSAHTPRLDAPMPALEVVQLRLFLVALGKRELLLAAAPSG